MPFGANRSTNGTRLSRAFARRRTDLAPAVASLFAIEEPGFWALTRRADIAFASTHPELFTSAQGVALDPMPAEIQRFASFFLTMDPPEHSNYRRLISSAFTPRNVRHIEQQIHRGAVPIVDDLIGAGDIDFVSECSTRLPMLTIVEMLGVPAADHPRWPGGREALLDERRRIQLDRGAGRQHHQRDHAAVQYGADLRSSAARPGDDLMTSIVNAEVDGQRLTDDEIGAFLILLSSAGNDTTKQTTTHAMMALVENPDQWAWLIEDFEDRIGPRSRSSCDGPRRCCSSPGLPPRTPRSTVIRPAGDKVGLFYCSANRDDSVFDPQAFDLRAHPTRISASVAGSAFLSRQPVGQAELRNLFRELLTRLQTVEFGEPDLLYSSFVHGVKRLPALRLSTIGSEVS